MSDQTYKIIITGELHNGISLSDAVNTFAALFKMDPARVQARFDQAPAVINSKASREKAEKIQKVLISKGIGCEISPNQAAESQAKAVGVPADMSSQQKGSQMPPTSALASTPQSFKGLEFTLSGQPDYAFLKVHIPADETLKVEASSMATMDSHIKMKTKLKGGFTRFLSGESLFINEFTAQNAPGEIGISPGAPGDMCHQYLDNDTIYLQNSAYVASTMEVNVETKWQGLTKGFFSGESLFLIRCSGRGDLWFNTYGSLIEIDVTDDYVVDTGNIVAFTEGLEYRISKVGGYKSLFFSGEGFVCRFSGKGKVWIQTRGAAAFTDWAHWFRPVKKRG